MELSKEKNGNKIADTTVIGKITKNTVSEYKFSETETNTRVDGCKTCDTAKVLFNFSEFAIYRF
jgi:hypothetical protein